MSLTGIAWGIASTTSIAATVRLTLLFVFVHFLAISLLVATAAYFFVGRLLGPGIAGLPGRRRQYGLFTQVGDGEQLEFGYCFDVSGLFRSITGESRRLQRVWQKNLFHDSGRDTGIFSRLGLAICSTVYSRTSNNKRLLVSIRSYF